MSSVDQDCARSRPAPEGPVGLGGGPEPPTLSPGELTMSIRARTWAWSLGRGQGSACAQAPLGLGQGLGLSLGPGSGLACLFLGTRVILLRALPGARFPRFLPNPSPHQRHMSLPAAEFCLEHTLKKSESIFTVSRVLEGQGQFGSSRRRGLTEQLRV